MAETLDIAVEITWSSNVSAEILRGIREFSLTRPRWLLRHVDSGPEHLPLGQPWKPAAGIYAGGTAAFRGIFGKLPGPVVVIGDCSFKTDLRIDLDDEPIGKLAMQHFLDRGFRRFGFVGNGTGYARKRCASFAAALATHGLECQLCPAGPTGMNPVANSAVSDWLTALPKPVALLCSNDPVARDLLSVCHAAKLRVPEEIAILGIDNDPVWCEASTPQLSSVIIPWRRFGWEAAFWLDRLITGAKAPAKGVVYLPPRDIMTRQSTDSVAVTDPELARALAYIRLHACEGLSVKQLVQALPIDRRMLERKFKEQLQRSPHDEIRRVRVDRAKLLLTETALTPDQIAAQTGLSSNHFADVFSKAVGVTPLQYRRRER